MGHLIKLEEAIEIIEHNVRSIDNESIGLRDALGRVLAQDIYAHLNLPPFNRSPLDGFALKAADIANATPQQPVKLKVTREIPAGYCSAQEVNPLETVKIFTGAPIPLGADAIIRFEEVQREGNFIVVTKPLPAYSNYCFCGEDISEGELVLAKGTMLTPTEISILAGLGVNKVPVYRRPNIGVISTGSELVDILNPLSPGKIYNSNLYGIAACVQNLGAIPLLTEIAPDDPAVLSSRIENILPQTDLLITTGGVSAGDYDVVKKSLETLGATILFRHINMRPGTPVLSALLENKLVLGLSGNPSAALISFYLLATSAIRKLMGLTNYQLRSTRAVLMDDYVKVSKQRRFLRGFVYSDETTLKVKLTGSQSTGIIKSLLNCNALIDVPAGTKALTKGDTVKVILL